MDRLQGKERTNHFLGLAAVGHEEHQVVTGHAAQITMVGIGCIDDETRLADGR